MGRSVNSPHRRSDAKDDSDGVFHVSMYYEFVGEKDLKNRWLLCWPVKGDKMTWAMLVTRKGTEFPCDAERVAKFIDQFGHNRVTLRCVNELVTEALARETAQARQEGSQTVQRDHQWESQSNGFIERTVELVGWSGQNAESCIGASYWCQSPA